MSTDERNVLSLTYLLPFRFSRNPTSTSVLGPLFHFERVLFVPTNKTGGEEGECSWRPEKSCPDPSHERNPTSSLTVDEEDVQGP